MICQRALYNDQASPFVSRGVSWQKPEVLVRSEVSITIRVNSAGDHFTTERSIVVAFDRRRHHAEATPSLPRHHACINKARQV